MIKGEQRRVYSEVAITGLIDLGQLSSKCECRSFGCFCTRKWLFLIFTGLLKWRGRGGRRGAS